MAVREVKRLKTFSVFKMSLMVSFVMILAWVIIVSALYLVLNKTGAVDSVNSTLSDLLDSTDYSLTSSRVLIAAAALGVFSAIIFTLGSLLATWIYNLSSDITGGLAFESTAKQGRHRKEDFDA